MNRHYRIVWNQVRAAFMVVAENARSYCRGGRSATSISIARTSPKNSKGSSAPFRVRALVVAVAGTGLLFAGGLQAADLPSGGQITAGSGNISQHDQTLTVQQNSAKLITQWQSFDISSGYSVNFQQPDASSVALNRIEGTDGSRIYGSLNANGQVFLVNPNGILFGKGASIDVGGLVASTLNITDENFLQGNYIFEGEGGSASIINRGSIRADGGAIALLGGQVRNDGLIAARLGTVALGAGAQMTLDFAGDGLMSITVDKAAVDALVANHELIQADGGQVLMTAKASEALLQTVVNNTGVIEARTVEQRAGKIVLLGGFDGGTVEVAGALDASAPNGGDGGFIETSGYKVDFGAVKVSAAAPYGDSGEWLLDPADVVIDAVAAAAIETALNNDTDFSLLTRPPAIGIADPAPSERGNITLDAPIIKTAAPYQRTDVVTKTMGARGDILPGIETEALPDGVTPVYLELHEHNVNTASSDVNLVSRTLLSSTEANSKLASGDATNPNFDHYTIAAVPAGVEVVNMVSRKVKNVPTLTLDSGWGNITINEDAHIRSVNGILNVVMRAGSQPALYARTESVNINADILTNGGDIAIQANEKISVANAVTLSTRDLFGINTAAPREIGTDIGQINPALFVQSSQIAANTQGESGNIVLLVDKFANGFTNFALFYRSDLATIEVGESAALLAESNAARDGAIRLLAVANIGDVFEAINWLAVRNFAAATVDIGNNAQIKGGAVDIIAESYSEADVGNLIESFAFNTASGALDATAPVVSLNEDDGTPSFVEDATATLLDFQADPFAVNTVAGESSARGDSAEDLPGYQIDVVNVPKLPLKVGNAASSGMIKLVEAIPVIGDILTLSPMAIAIAESRSELTVGEGAHISGKDVVTVRSNSGAYAYADAEFPGLAFSLTVNNSHSTLDVKQGAIIESSATDRQEPTAQLINDQPLLRFDTSQVESFGVARGHLQPAERGSLAAVDVASYSETFSDIDVTAATLDLSLQEKIVDDATKARAKKDGTNQVPAKKDAIDSPIDVALGIMVVENTSKLTLEENALISAPEGTAAVSAYASIVKSNNSVTGGSLQTPGVQCTEPNSSACHTTAEYDGSDIVNIAVAIGSITNKAEINIDGKVQAQTVEISSTAESNKYSNGATAQQGYDNSFDEGAAIRKKLKSKNDPDLAEQLQNKLKDLITGLAGKIKGKTGSAGASKITVIEDSPEKQLFGLAGGVAVSVINQSAKTVIGGSAEIISDGGSLSTTAESSSGTINNFAKTGVQNGRTNAVAASVAVGVYDFSADIKVEDGAKFRALNPAVSSDALADGQTAAITVAAQSYIDSPFMASKYIKKSYMSDMKSLGGKIFKEGPAGIVKGFTGGNKSDPVGDYARERVNELLDKGQLLTTNWASSYYINGGSPAYQGKDTFLGTEKDADGNAIAPPTEELNAKSDYSSDVSVAGAFGLVTSDNNATTTIGDASFEVINGAVDNANDINIGAETWAHTVMAAGNVAPPDPNANNLLESFAPGDRAGKGVGGALNIQEGSGEATVDIKDGASFDTELGAVVALANSHRETQLVQVSGGIAEDVGVNGAFGVNIFNDGAYTRIADGAFINAQSIDVSATIMQPGMFNLSGGFAVSGAVGVGLGIGVNVVTRNAEAVLGYVGAGSEAAGGGHYNADEVAVVATQEGFITNIDVAGGIQAPEDKSKEVQGGAGTTAESSTSPTEAATEAAKKAAGGVGISGSVAVNISNASTKAHGILDAGSSIKDTVLVRADDAVDLTGLSGAAGITINGGVAVAGAASINTVVSATDALLEARQSDGSFAANGAAYTPYDVEVSAANIGRIEAVALGVAVVAGVPDDEGGDGPSVAAAGSFTYNSVRNNAFANIDNSHIVLDLAPGEDEEDAAVRVLVNDGAQIVSVAGALAISLGSEKNVASVGAGVAVNTIQNRGEALVSASHIDDAANNMSKGMVVGASRISPIYSFGIAGGVGTSKMAAAASVVINTINTEAGMGTYAGIDDSMIKTAGPVSVYTGDEAQIVSLAGAVAATSGKAAVGGSFVWNEISGAVSSSVTDSNIETDEGINVQAITESPNTVVDTPLTPDLLISKAKEVGKNVGTIVSQGARGALALRKGANAPVVAEVDSNDLVEGANGIYTAAVAGGGAKDVAVFGSFAVNSLHKEITSTVTASTLLSDGDILLNTQADGNIRSLAGSIAISLGVAGVGGAGTYNTIRDQSLVTVTNSTIEGDDVLVSAGRTGSVKTLGAAAAIASTVGVQGSAAITTMVGQTASSVQGGSIKAEGRAAVTANAAVDTATVAGGVAGSTTVAVGASVAVTVAEDKTSAKVGTNVASSLSGKDAVDVLAQSRDQHDTAVVTVSVSGTVGVAGSVGIKIVNTETTAAVGNNTVINTVGYNGVVNVKSDAGLILTGAAGAIGAAGTVGVGAGLDLNVVNSLSSATIGNGADVSGLDVFVQAENQRDLGSVVVAGGGGLVGVAGAVSVIHVGGGDMNAEGGQALGQEDYTDADGNTKRAGDVKAHAQGMIDERFSSAQIKTASSTPVNGDTIAYVGAATLEATRDIGVSANARHDVDVMSGGLGVGAVGAGAGISSVTYNSKTSAVTQNATLVAGDDVSVTASDKDQNTHTPLWLTATTAARTTDVDMKDGDDFGIHSFAGSIGLAALGAAVGVVNRDNDTSAEIRGGATTALDHVDVHADRDRYTRVFSLGAQVGAATAGASISDITNNGSVLASAGGAIGTEGSEASVLSVQATGDNKNDAVAHAASSGVIVGASGTVAAIRGESLDLDAFIAADAQVYLKQSSNGSTLDSATGRTDILAQGSNADRALTDGTNVGLGAGVGAMESRISSSSDTNAAIGEGAELEVQGFITLTSLVDGADLNSKDEKMHPTNVAEARGAAAGLIAGVNSVVAVSEQEVNSTVAIGDSAKLNGSRITFNASTLGGTDMLAAGGAFAGVAGVNVMSSMDLDHHTSAVNVGNNAEIIGNTIEFFSTTNLLNEVSTAAISGGIANATLVQNANTWNVDTGRKLATDASINVGDGASIDSLNNTTFSSRSFFGGWTQGNGSAGGASAITTLNSNYFVDHDAAITIGAADIHAGRTLSIDAQTDRNFLTQFDAKAFGVGAGATVNINGNVSGAAKINLQDGALVSGEAVNLNASDLQRNHKLKGMAEIGAAVGSADTHLVSNIAMSQIVDIDAGAEVRSKDITLRADAGAASRVETIEVEQKNQSLTFFLEGDKQTIAHNYQAQILLEGDLHSTATGGGSVKIEERFGDLLVNGRYTGSESVPFAYLEDGNLVVESLAPSADSGKVKIDAGSGNITGAGKVFNAGGFFETVEIISGRGVIINGLTTSGETGAEPQVSVTSGNGYTANVVGASGGAPTLMVDAAGGIIINDDIDLGEGSTTLIAHGTAVNTAPNIEMAAGKVLRTGSLDIRAENGRVGTEDTPITVTFIDNSVLSDSVLSGKAGGSVTPGIFNLAATLEGSNARLRLGDIDARNQISLVLGTLSGGGTANYEVTAASMLSSLGQIKIDGSDENVNLIVNGTVRSGFDPATTTLATIINADGTVTSDWAGLYLKADSTELGEQLILGPIQRTSGGVIIDVGDVSGSGDIIGNGRGMDVSITNNFADLYALSVMGIELPEADVAVSVNGDTAVTKIGGLKIERITSTGPNDISIVDPYSRQFIILDDVKTSGQLTIDVQNAFSVQASDVLSGDSPTIIAADTLVLNTLRATSVGNAEQSLRVNVGAGGLDIKAAGFVYLTDIAGDLKIANLENQAFPDTVTANTFLRADAGSITTADGAFLLSENIDFTAADDIALGNTLYNISGKANLNAQNIDVFGENINFGSVIASGNLMVTALESLSGGPLQVAGSTTISAKNVVLNNPFNDFTGPVNFELNGAADTAFTLFDANSLVLGDIKALDYVGSAPNVQVFITASDGITQSADTSIIAAINTTFASDGDIVLGNADNFWTNGALINVTGANNLSLNSFQAEGLDLGTLNVFGNLSVTSAGPLTQTGILTVNGASSFTTADDLTLFHANNTFGGAVSLDVAGKAKLGSTASIGLGTVDVFGESYIASGQGSLTDSGTINFGGEALLLAQNGDIVFDTPTNNLGKVGGNAINVTLVNGDELMGVFPFDISGKLALDASIMDFLPRTSATHTNAGLYAASNHLGALDLRVRDSDIQFPNPSNPSESFVVTGDVDLSSSLIVINNADFGGAVGIHGTASSHAEITNNAADVDFMLGDSLVGTLLVNVPDGSISQKEGTAIDAYLVELRAKGDITLNNADNAFDNINILSAKDVIIAGTGDLKIQVDATSTPGFAVQSLDLSADSISVAAAGTSLIDEELSTAALVKVAGNTSLRANNGSMIFDGDEGFDIGGDATLAASGLVYISNIDQIDGKLSLDGGTVDVIMTKIINAGGSLREIGIPVNLGTVRSAGNLRVMGGSINMDSAEVGGNMELWSSFWNTNNSIDGAITAHGLISVGGTTTIQSIGDVTLDNTDNSFTGAVNILDMTLGAHRANTWNFELELPSIDVTLASGSDLTLGNISMPKNTGPNGTGVRVFTGPTNFNLVDWPTGILNVSSTGDITQSAALVLAGNTSFTAGGALNLSHADNDFQAAPTFSGASVKVVDVNDLTLGAVTTTGGALELTATSISVPTALNIKGDASFNATGAVTASNEANIITGKVAANTGNFTLRQQNDLLLGEIFTTGNLDLKSVLGSILFDTNSLIDVDGNANFDTRNGALSLTGANTTVDGSISMVAQDITLQSTGAVVLGEVTICNGYGICDALDGFDGNIDVTGKSITVENSNLAARNAVNLHATSGDILFNGLSAGIEAASAKLQATGDVYGYLLHAADWGLQLDVSGPLSVSANNGYLSLRNPDQVLGTVNSAGDLELYLDSSQPGTITQTDAMHVGGNLRITDNGYSHRQRLELDNDANTFAGTITSSSGDLVLHASSTLRLSSLSAYAYSGDTANGYIELHSSDNIIGDGGYMSFDSASMHTPGDIELQDFGLSDRTDLMEMSAHNISISSGSMPRFSSLAVGGDLWIENLNNDPYGFEMRSSGPITVAGATTLISPTGIRFQDENNIFNGAVAIVSSSNVKLAAKEGITFSSIDMTASEGGGQQCQDCQGPEEASPTFLEVQAHNGDIIATGPVIADSVKLILADGRNVVMDNPGNVLGGSPDFEPSIYEPEFSAVSDGPLGRLGNISLVDSTFLRLVPREPEDESGIFPVTLDVDGDINIRSLESIILQQDEPLTTLLRAGGNIVLAAGEDFINYSGNTNPLEAGGRWLVYSRRPDYNLDDITMAKDFFAYGTSYLPADPIPASLPAGNGLIYIIQPTLEGVSLVIDDQSITYGESINTTISGAALVGAAISGVSFDGDLISESDRALYGINLPTELTASDVSVTLNEDVITRSNGGFVNADVYTNGLAVAVNPTSAAGLSGLTIGGAGNLTVSKANLDITSTNVSRTYDGSTAASATAVVGSSTSLKNGDLISGGSFAFADANAGIGNKVVNVSGVTVNDGNNGNNYNVSFIPNTSSTINPAALTISANNDNQVYNGVAYSGGNGVAYSGFVNGETPSVLAGTLAYGGTSQGAVNAGNYAITPQGLDSDNYNISFVDGELQISQASLTLGVGADDKTKIYGHSDPALTWNINSGALVGSDTFTGALARDAGEIVGDYTIRQGSLTAGANYQINFSNGELSITPRAISITSGDIQKTYDGTTSANGIAVAVSGTLAFSDSFSGGSYAFADANAGVGNKVVNVSDVTVNDGNEGNNYSVSYLANTTSTIDPAALSISANNASHTYDGTAFTGGNGVSYSGFVNGETESVLTGTLSYAGTSQGAVDAGHYTLSPAGLSNGNYAVTFIDGDLHIVQAGLALSLAADNKSKVYGDVDPLFTFQVTDGTLVGDDEFTGALSRDAGENTGNYAIVQGTLSAGDNYAITFTNGELSITPRPISITSTAAQKAYDGGTSATATAVLQAGTLVGSDSISGGSFAFAQPNAGIKRAVNVSGVSINDGNNGNNYDISYVANTDSIIDPVELTVTANALNRVYDGTPFSGGNGVSYSGFVGGEGTEVLGGSIGYDGSSQGAVDAGSYELTPGGLISGNYTFNYVNGTLKIFPAGIVLMGIGADDKVKVYGDADPEFTFQVVEGALVDGDVFSGTLTRDAGENVGDYAIGQGSLSAGDNYVISFEDGVLSITPRAIAITSADVQKTYDGTTSANGSAIAGSGTLAFSDSFSGGSYTFADANAGAGNKVVNVSDVTVNDGNNGNNYSVSYLANSSSTIDPAALTVTANNFSLIYDGNAFSGGNGVSYSGFVNGENDSVLNGTLSYGGSSQGAVDADTYTITPSGLNAGNYDLTFIDGQLVINPADLFVLAVGADNKNKVYGNADPVLTWQLNGGTLVEGDEFTGDLTRDTGENVGNYTIRQGTLSAGSNYNISFSNGVLSITPRPLVVTSSAVVKTYDSTVAADGSVVLASGAPVGGDSLSGGNFAFSDVNAGTGKVVTVSGVLANDGNGGANYNISYASNTSSIINKAVLDISGSFTVADKTYDGTTAATIASNNLKFTGLVGADVLSLGDLNASFADANVGAGKTVSLGGANLASLGGKNYTINGALPTASGSISRASLIISTADISRPYDGTTNVSGNPIAAGGSTLFGSDTLNGGSFAFTDPNAGTGKTVTVSGVSVNDGNSGANYDVSFADNTNSTISKASLILTAGTGSKVYDGTVTSDGTVNIAGLYGSDTVSNLVQAFDAAEAGTRTLVVTGFKVNDGHDGANYDVVLQTATGVIEQALLTLTPQQRSRIYGMAFDFSGTEFYIVEGNLIGTDQVVSVTLFSEGATDEAVPGQYSISISDAEGTGLGNYQISYADAPDGFTVESASSLFAEVLTVISGNPTSGSDDDTGGSGGAGFTGGVSLSGGLPAPGPSPVDGLVNFAADGIGGTGGFGAAGGAGGAALDTTPAGDDQNTDDDEDETETAQ